MSETYEPCELFVYMNGDHWELGEVKCPNNTGDGYFCRYSKGDTAANTPTSCMHKLANAGMALAQTIEATLGETPTPPPPNPPEQPPYDLLIDLLRDEWYIDVRWDGLRRLWRVGLTDEGVRKRELGVEL